MKGLSGTPDVTLGGQSYHSLTAGGKTWLGNNLYLTTSDTNPEGLSYRGAPILDQGAGRLYNWEEANAICPAGWHLPTVTEYHACFDGPDGNISAGALMVDATFRDESMWEYCPDVVITNSFGFNAIPAGYVNAQNKFTPYETYGQYAAFWTADQENDLGTFLYIHRENPVVQRASADKKTMYLSVRCVKD